MESKDIITYDSGFNWYRWKATMSIKDIKKVIDKNLENRFNANPELILTMTSEAEDGKEAVFESLPVDTVGNIVDILVLNRDSSGIITELLITGSKKTIKVRKEYNIRALLAPTYDTLIRLDASEVEGLSLLPSAFFMIDKNEKDDKLSSITVSGGGYGHGVGMSQNGVKALADSGKNYEDILLYFYADTDMGFIYE
jgi:stage II sporulation protein D